MNCLTPSNKFIKLIHDHLAQAVAHTRVINNPFAYTENYSTPVRVLDVLLHAWSGKNKYISSIYAASNACCGSERAFYNWRLYDTLIKHDKAKYGATQWTDNIILNLHGQINSSDPF